MLSTMDVGWSEDMGGKEGLSALGWSRNRIKGEYGYQPELWVNDENDMLWVSPDGAKMTHRLKNAGYDIALEIGVCEMKSCIKRCEELRAGDCE